MKVFVRNKDGSPLMPCESVIARLLLKQGKAKVYRRTPFAIQLNYQIEDPYLQAVEVGIDDGFEKVGISAVRKGTQGHSDEVLIKGELLLRNDVKNKKELQRVLRRNRRSKLRYRKPRYHNRGSAKRNGRLPPTPRTKKEQIWRVVNTIAKYLPISKIVYEEANFDIRKIQNPHIEGEEYQKSPIDCEWEDKKHKVLWRDRYTCQYCGEKHKKMTVDHIIPKSRGGSDAFENLVVACWNCNDDKGNRTAEEFGYPDIKGKMFKYPAHLHIGKAWLKERLSEIAPVVVIAGWETKHWRKTVRLEKTHCNDAIAMVCRGNNFVNECPLYQIQTRRRNIRQLHLANFQKGHVRRSYGRNKSKHGFRRGDLIRTKRGVAYINAIRKNGYLQYDIDGKRTAASPKNVQLIESVKPVSFFAILSPINEGVSLR